tara:strand:- start:213 stop:395 length:183 start_codon:yes stop_codon:yes gene_type:complete
VSREASAPWIHFQENQWDHTSKQIVHGACTLAPHNATVAALITIVVAQTTIEWLTEGSLP